MLIKRFFRIFTFIALILLSACSILENQQVPAVLKGRVSVGPLTPVVHPDSTPEPVPPEVYTTRALLIYKPNGKTLVKRVQFNPDGTYTVELKPGNYLLDLPKEGIEHSSQLPQTISLEAGETRIFDFDIDTGIR